MKNLTKRSEYCGDCNRTDKALKYAMNYSRATSAITQVDWLNARINPQDLKICADIVDRLYDSEFNGSKRFGHNSYILPNGLEFSTINLIEGIAYARNKDIAKKYSILYMPTIFSTIKYSTLSEIPRENIEYLGKIENQQDIDPYLLSLCKPVVYNWPIEKTTQLDQETTQEYTDGDVEENTSNSSTYYDYVASNPSIGKAPRAPKQIKNKKNNNIGSRINEWFLKQFANVQIGIRFAEILRRAETGSRYDNYYKMALIRSGANELLFEKAKRLVKEKRYIPGAIENGIMIPSPIGFVETEV
jgi:hypothetical protein